MIEAHSDCEACGADLRIRAGEDPPGRCPRCEAELAWHAANFREGDRLVHCLRCGRADFYEQNQINPNFGVSMVVLGAVGFGVLVFWIPGMNGFLWGTVVLLSLAVLDRLLRLWLPEVVICYHCSTVYRGTDPRQDFDPYDHERAAEIQYAE